MDKSLFVTKNKMDRDSTIREWLFNSFTEEVELFDNCNTYSYKVKFYNVDTVFMLYTSTLKVVVQGKPTFVFNNLQELKQYLLEL